MKNQEKEMDIMKALKKEIEIPDKVKNSLDMVYDKIRKDEVQMKHPAKHRKKQRMYKRFGIAAAAACLAFAFSGVLYMNPSLAKDIPILGDVFGRLQEIKEGSINPDKDTTAYVNIQKNSEPIQSDSENGITNTAADQGITMSVKDAYCDGYDLYFTFSLRVEDAELKEADNIEVMRFEEGDSIPFTAWLTINGEQAYTETSISPAKSEDGVYVMLARVHSRDLKSGQFPEDMTVELNADAVAGHKTGQSETNESMFKGFKFVEGSWKLNFKPSMDTSQNKSTQLNAEDNGFIIKEAVQTPSNMHMTVYLPAEYASKNPGLVLTDEAGNKVGIESAKIKEQGDGSQLQQIIFDHSDAAQFTLQVLDKNADPDENGNLIVLGQIPFTME